jgi:hypothetical protein
MTISTFYMSTKAAYDVWLPQATPPAPPRVDTSNSFAIGYSSLRPRWVSSFSTGSRTSRRW